VFDRESSPDLGTRVGRALVKAITPSVTPAPLSAYPSSSDMALMMMMEVDEAADNNNNHNNHHQNNASSSSVTHELKNQVSLETVTGALMGIRALGPNATKAILLPNLPVVAKVLGQDQLLQDEGNTMTSNNEKMQRMKARQALTLVLGDYMRYSMQLPSSSSVVVSESQRLHERPGMELCGLEEQLAPFLVAESTPDSQHFLLRLTF